MNILKVHRRRICAFGCLLRVKCYNVSSFPFSHRRPKLGFVPLVAFNKTSSRVCVAMFSPFLNPVVFAPPWLWYLSDLFLYKEGEAKKKEICKQEIELKYLGSFRKKAKLLQLGCRRICLSLLFVFGVILI
ncbi:hypothetical protein L1987_15933 [Smallanthus sonchifolius]|uniref:Uncharacterized protein n=1 Tax=Smallanthus sonchifolius TaxID=185202 RepID=A0ACB9J7H6_9ASTR|nr:hypothetical protein L1987_15933 [Smallanthus sonchifolius]